jgi:predicted RNA methylase
MSLDQFFTSSGLAGRIVEWAQVQKHERWLEPSAGAGAFVIPMIAAGASVKAIELDKKLVPGLRRLFTGEAQQTNVLRADFLKVTPPPGEFHFAGVIMNPPYGSRAEGTVALDARHVAHALNFAPRVIALVAAAFMHSERRQKILWNHAVVTRRVEFWNRPAFGGPADKGEQPQRDYILIQVERKTQAVAEQGAVQMVATERWEA